MKRAAGWYKVKHKGHAKYAMAEWKPESKTWHYKSWTMKYDRDFDFISEYPIMDTEGNVL